MEIVCCEKNQIDHVYPLKPAQRTDLILTRLDEELTQLINKKYL
jgi:hypothetical protein